MSKIDFSTFSLVVERYDFAHVPADAERYIGTISINHGSGFANQLPGSLKTLKQLIIRLNDSLAVIDIYDAMGRYVYQYELAAIDSNGKEEIKHVFITRSKNRYNELIVEAFRGAVVYAVYASSTAGDIGVFIDILHSKHASTTIVNRDIPEAEFGGYNRTAAIDYPKDIGSSFHYHKFGECEDLQATLDSLITGGKGFKQFAHNRTATSAPEQPTVSEKPRNTADQETSYAQYDLCVNRGAMKDCRDTVTKIKENPNPVLSDAENDIFDGFQLRDALDEFIRSIFPSTDTPEVHSDKSIIIREEYRKLAICGGALSFAAFKAAVLEALDKYNASRVGCDKCTEVCDTQDVPSTDMTDREMMQYIIKELDGIKSVINTLR